MALVIDSSVFIEAERRGIDLSEIAAGLPEDEALALATISIAELRVGVYLSQPSNWRTAREQFIQRILGQFPLLDFDLLVAGVYAELWARLRRAGNLTSPHDLMIGATALAHGYNVLTLNTRHFDRIPGLEVRQPGW